MKRFKYFQKWSFQMLGTFSVPFPKNGKHNLARHQSKLAERYFKETDIQTSKVRQFVTLKIL